MNGDFFAIREHPDWGDYWRILICGMSSYMPRINGRLRYLRTGPYIPPMVVSGIGDLIVSDNLRDLIGNTDGVKRLREVVKEKIVRLDWSQWTVGEEVRSFLHWEEPESALIDGVHDAQLAAEVAGLYEVELLTDGSIYEDFDDAGNYVATFQTWPTKNYKLFAATTPGSYQLPIASKNLIESWSPDITRWVHFEPVR